MSDWLAVTDVRHFDEAYRMLGLSFDDFSCIGDNVWVAKDGKWRVSPYVDDLGRSCRLVEMDCELHEPALVESIRGLLKMMDWFRESLSPGDYKKFLTTMEWLAKNWDDLTRPN